MRVINLSYWDSDYTVHHDRAFTCLTSALEFLDYVHAERGLMLLSNGYIRDYERREGTMVLAAAYDSIGRFWQASYKSGRASGKLDGLKAAEGGQK